MNFRLPQRLNTKIKAGRVVEAPLHENPYADWSARLFTVDRRQYILLSNTASLYSVVMLGRGIADDGTFSRCALDTVRAFMTDDGLKLIYANFIAPASGSIRLCKALNRSVTGSMNELEMMAKCFLQGGGGLPFAVASRLNETLLSTIGKSQAYDRPRDAFKRLRVD